MVLVNAFVSRLVCSDLISRGIDISHVSHVVSYDAPVDIRKYVHRVGRTARAGRTGDAWSLVEEQEVCCGSFQYPSLDWRTAVLFLGTILQENPERRPPSFKSSQVEGLGGRSERLKRVL